MPRRGLTSHELLLLMAIEHGSRVHPTPSLQVVWTLPAHVVGWLQRTCLLPVAMRTLAPVVNDSRAA